MIVHSLPLVLYWPFVFIVIMQVEAGSGLMEPFYDDDTGVLFIAGKVIFVHIPVRSALVLCCMSSHLILSPFL